MNDLLITGATGLIGTVLRRRLPATYAIRGIDRRPAGERRVRRVDVTRPRSLARAVVGVDAVVHLASTARADADWPIVLKNDIAGTLNVLEAAREAGVRRFVYASSNHVTGMYEEEQPYSSIVAGDYTGLDPCEIPLIGTGWPVRPDGPYGIAKALGETAVRYYADRFGLQGICLRLGTVTQEDRPTRPRHFSTLLSHADLVRLVECALQTPEEVRFGTFYGVSANRWRFWDLADAEDAIGFDPQDDAERFRLSSDTGA